MSESNKDLETFYPEGNIVKIVDKATKEQLSFSISEFTLKNRIVFVRLIAHVMKKVFADPNAVKGMKDSEMIVRLIESAGDKLGEVYAALLGKPLEWCQENITLKNEVDLIKAIVEVNDIPLLLSQVQAMIKGKF